MADRAVLKTLLQNDTTRYDAAVRSGNNGVCVVLLNEEDPASAFVFSDVGVPDLLEAAGQVKLAGLTTDQRARLNVLKDQGQIALSKPAIRAEFLNVFDITEDQLALGIPSVRRRSSFAEDAGVGVPNLEDVRAVVRLIAKSFIVSTGQV